MHCAILKVKSRILYILLATIRIEIFDKGSLLENPVLQRQDSYFYWDKAGGFEHGEVESFQ